MTSRGMGCVCRVMLSGLGLLLLAVSASPPAVWSAEEPDAGRKSAAVAAADKFEAALKQAEFGYQRTGGSGQPITFRIGVKDSDGRTSTQFYRVIEQNWKYANGTRAVLVHGVADVVAAADLPPGADQKIAQYNDKCTATGTCLNKSGACAYTGFLYDGGVNPETMSSYVYFLHDTVVGLRGVLQPRAKPAAEGK